jgi:hypothetical protein
MSSNLSSMKFMQRQDSNIQLKRLLQEQEQRQIEQKWISTRIDSCKSIEIEPSLYALSKQNTRLSFGRELVEPKVEEKQVELKTEVEKLIGTHIRKSGGRGRLLYEDPKNQSILDHHSTVMKFQKGKVEKKKKKVKQSKDAKNA